MARYRGDDVKRKQNHVMMLWLFIFSIYTYDHFKAILRTSKYQFHRSRNNSISSYIRSRSRINQLNRTRCYVGFYFRWAFQVIQGQFQIQIQRFTASSSHHLPWSFFKLQQNMKVHIHNQGIQTGPGGHGYILLQDSSLPYTYNRSIYSQIL